MRRRDRLLAFGMIIALVGAAKLGQQLYRWYAFAEERAELSELHVELEEAAEGIIRTQLRADSLRARIEGVDVELRARRGSLAHEESYVVSAEISRAPSLSFQRSLTGYNQQVSERNELFVDWRATIESNQEHVRRYNRLVDEIREGAARMGEAYYPIPSPAEVAYRRGLLNGDP